MSAPWSPPQEFDDYALLHPLGSGAMGKVYLAEDTVLARRVAVKFIDGDPDAGARQRFLIEARAAARVQHPNVVSIYRVGELEERPYLITEFVRGRTLAALEKPLPWQRVLQIAIDLSRGLAAAHRRGVLHCDVKSANAVLGEDGSAKLLDFGLATLLAARDGAEAREASAALGAVSGTPDYMAPEIWRAEPASRRSDVYGLGAVLFELCTGLTPFGRTPAEELARAVQDSEPSAVSELAAGVDERLAAIIARCLRKRPDDRFASGDELRAALEELARTASGASVPEGNPYRGLRAFEADHRALFFGRGSEIGQVLDRLRSEHFVLVTGDSGVGKSSLCRAGVLPAVAEGALGGRAWTTALFVPGRHPLQNLAAALAGALRLDARALHDQLARDPSTIAFSLRKELGDQRGLLLFVDQLEELLTVAAPDEGEKADAALAAIAAGVPGCKLLGSLRADLLTRFAAGSSLGDDLSRVLFFLRPLARERVREVIAGPARATGTRFSPEELIDELAAATAQAQTGLPLLQFALAELWEARDRASNAITREALDARGGVAGALARHADAVLHSMLPASRAAAQRMLVRLVTAQGTRARRTEAELAGSDPAARAALEELVRGRLLAPHDAEDGASYELAHEVLISGWSTLRELLADDAGGRAVRERLSRAADEWERLGGARELLWRSRQLRELAERPSGPLSPREDKFVQASHRAHRQRLVQRALLAAGVLCTIGAVALGMSMKAHHALDQKIQSRMHDGQQALAAARATGESASTARQAAFELFDGHRRAEAEAKWAEALKLGDAAAREATRASSLIEAALALDPSRQDVRAAFAEVLEARAERAERLRQPAQREELLERLALYDQSGERLRRLQAPASVQLATTPPAAEVLEETRAADGALKLEPLGSAPLARTLSAGLHQLVLRSAGVDDVRYPVLLAHGESLLLEVPLPRPGAVPKGFVYVAPGRFLFGSTADEEVRRGFFDTVPLHEAKTGAFLISEREVTYGEWLDFLRALPADERARRRPGVTGGVSEGHLEVRELDGVFQIALKPAGDLTSAREGELLRYPRRAAHQTPDWRKLPVAAVSAADAQAYAAWLDKTGRVPGARLCTELEWERAARGADDRLWPHGSIFEKDDANLDETHGKESLGPDEVGSHPRSRSPFGIDDMAGNVFEWTTSAFDAAGFVARGGSYFHDQKTAQVANRSVTNSTLRDPTLGVRLCASVAP